MVGISQAFAGYGNMIRKPTALLVILMSGFTLRASACLWDSDTLAHEAKGIPEVIQVITGRFERNPPLYYQMRLKRVAAEIVVHPEKLELYDDAGVACDRLGRDDEAIQWMARKKTILERIGGPSNASVHDQWYRYYANLGTFYAHRWARAGADPKKTGDLKRAKELLTTAIKINPDAHFGREKYQLKAIEWLISCAQSPKDADLFDIFARDADPKPADAREAVRGLSGLIVLGNAWESADVFYALAEALSVDEHRAWVAYLARLRACELVDQGKRPFGLKDYTQDDIKLYLREEGRPGLRIQREQKAWVESIYPGLRKEAEEWQAKRTDYMLARLHAGSHPDTDPAFWRDYKDTPPPAMPVPPLSNSRTVLPAGIIAVLVVGSAAVTLGLLRRRRRTRAKRD